MQELELKEDASGYAKIKCPVCKETIFNTDDGANPCCHIKMIYADCCGEFIHSDKDMEVIEKKIMEKVEEGSDLSDVMEDYAKEFGCEVYTVTQYGMACGPCSNTDYYMIEVEVEKKSKKKAKKKSKK